MSIQKRIIGVKVEFGGGVFKTEGDNLYAQMFGTTGPDQNPHWSWGEIDKSSKLGKDVMNFIGEL